MRLTTLTICAAILLIFSSNQSNAQGSAPSKKTKTHGELVPAAPPAVDSAAMMQAWMEYITPGEMHKVMASFDGTWESDFTHYMGEGAPPQQSKGAATFKTVYNGLFQESTHTGSFAGMQFEGKGLLAYDNAKKKFMVTIYKFTPNNLDWCNNATYLSGIKSDTMLLQITEFKSLIDLQKKFPTEQSCIDHIEAIRWNGNIVSPFDETSKVYKCAGNKYKCKNTGKYFNCRTGTILEDSKIPLLKWFMAIYLVNNRKKGISSHQLAKDIEVTQKSSWFMIHRIRYAFDHENFQKTLNDIVQADECFVGGRNKNRHADKKVPQSQGRSFKDKTPVLGLMANGHINLTVIPNTQASTIKPVIEKMVTEGAILVTDDWDAYRAMAARHPHVVIDHGRGEYARGCFNTNSVEGFWSHFKRTIYGTYHQVSRKHLHRYCAESAFRFNTRKAKDPERFNLCLTSIERRLTYKELTQK